MKKVLMRVLLIAVSLAAVAFSGCVSEPKQTMKFNEFEAYRSFNAQVSGVYVTDIVDGKAVRFTIEDGDVMTEIINYYLNAEFKYGGDGRYVGCNSVMHFVYETGNELSVNLGSIYENGRSYLYNDGSMQDLVKEIERSNLAQEQ
ncbi:MAG: hypothetical protein K2L72_06105 [Clostridia bacterium]|nr:hypothetical protein [Clostridia bacterium]